MECTGPCAALPRSTQGVTSSLNSSVPRQVFGTRYLSRASCGRQILVGVRCDASRRGVLQNQVFSALVQGTALAAVALTQCTPPAWAELEAVPPATVSSLARAIPQQKVDKGRIWSICILGAAGLFGGTILLENNERFFPAISKANKAMASARKNQKARAKLKEAIDVDGHADERLQSAVSAGLNEARQRVLSETTGSSAEAESTAEPGADLGQQHGTSPQKALHDRDSLSSAESEEVSEEWKESSRELVADSRNSSKS